MTYRKLSREQQAAVRAKVRETVQPLAADFVARHGALPDEAFVGVLTAWLQRQADLYGDGADPLDFVFGQELARACIARRNAIMTCAVAGSA